MTNPKVAYVINLDRRPDRWVQFLDNSSLIKIPIVRFPAVDGFNLPKSVLRSPAPIVACWMSHQAVAKEFLSTDADHCLILEDDIDIRTIDAELLEQLWSRDFNGIDLLQVGFCIHQNRLFNRAMHSVQVSAVETLARLRILKFAFSQRFLKERYGYKFEYLPNLEVVVAVNTFELGTHAYIISRNFAKAMISFNDPVYLPADLALMELVRTEHYRGARLTRSLVGQSDSPSSISNASSNVLESELSKITSELQL